MADGAVLMQRPVTRRRIWFVAPGEPRDRRTFERLCEAGLREVADALLMDRGSKQILEAIGKRGKEGLIRGIESRIAARIGHVLARQTLRQPVKRAAVEFRCVPVPSEHRLEGIVIVRAWGHTYRSTYNPEIMK